jgi:hypothetical protein
MKMNSFSVKHNIFKSELNDPEFMETMQGNFDGMMSYEDEIAAAADRLHTQFPDTSAAKWLATLNDQLKSMFPRDIQWTSAEKAAAFKKELRSL